MMDPQQYQLMMAQQAAMQQRGAPGGANPYQYMYYDQRRGPPAASMQ